jgi:zinc protease
MAAVEAPDIQRCSAELMRPGEGAALAAIGPGLPDREESRDPRELVEWVPEESGAEEPAAAAPAEPAAAAPAEPAAAAAAKTAVSHPPVRVVLPNGLTVLVSANTDSDVFAIHLAARGRSYCEPPGKSGIADLLHRLLPLGAGEWTRPEMGRELDRAGIQLKVTDNPGIPYDDYQTSQEYSFVRLETVDRFHREALALLGAMVFEPAITEESLEEVRREAVALAERRAGRSSTEARRLLDEAFYPDSPGSRPALGTVTDLGAITVDDVRAFHADYFAPSNLVVAIVTGLEPEPVMAAVEEHLGAAGGGSGGATAASYCASLEEMLPKPTLAPDRREIEVGQDQSWIRIGSVFNCNPADRAALEVAAMVLSDRVALELRERQGLAYSVGAALGSQQDRAWIVTSMGTRPENLARGEDGLVAGLRGLDESEITAEEVTKVVKSYTGRRRMRKITRINQARALCLDALLGREIGAESADLEALADVTPEDVRRVAGTYFSAAPLITVIAR